MGLMAIINLPVIILLAKPAILCMDDYIKQKKAGKDVYKRQLQPHARDCRAAGV